LSRVDEGVEAVDGDKPWKRGFRTATGIRSGQHEPTNEADQGCNDQPRPASTAQLSAKRQPDGPKTPPHFRFDLSVVGRGLVAKVVAWCYRRRGRTRPVKD
jgi:hypothetical protein